jgi:hypothetical protein
MNHNRSKVVAGARRGLTARSLVLTGLAAVGLSLVAGTASAHSSGLWLAKPPDITKQACTGDWYHSTVNGCPQTVNYEFPLDDANAGGFKANVTMEQNHALGVQCQAVSLDPSYDYVVTSSWASSYVVSIHTQLNITDGWVYSGGTVYLSCNVEPGGQINQVFW